MSEGAVHADADDFRTEVGVGGKASGDVAKLLRAHAGEGQGDEEDDGVLASDGQRDIGKTGGGFRLEGEGGGLGADGEGHRGSGCWVEDGSVNRRA